MCDKTSTHQASGHYAPAKGHNSTASCGCGSARFVRRFQSADEQIAALEKYRDDLRSEATAVEERIDALAQG